MKPLIEQIIPLCIVLLISISSTIPGCIMPGCIQGSGNYSTENRTVDDFSSIDLSGIGDVYLTQGEKDLRIEAEDNIIQEIKTEVGGGKLTIYHKARCINPHMPIKIFVSTPELESLSISGSGRIISQSPIDSKALNLRVSGSGNMELNAVCQDLQAMISGSGTALLKGEAARSEIVISGSGSMHGYDLQTDRSKVTISGSGIAEIYVMEELSALISGSGSLYCKGNPESVSQTVSGSGRVIVLDE